MSKNQDRYKEDYIALVENIEELDEIETEKFEKFRPKKKNPSKTKHKEVNRDSE